MTIQRKSEIVGTYIPFSFSSTGGVRRAYDITKIRSNIYVAITTMYGEQLLEPNKGSRLKNLLLEPSDYIIEQEIKNEITDVVSRTEPRATIEDVVVIRDDSKVTLQIHFKITGFEVPYSMVLDYFEEG